MHRGFVVTESEEGRGPEDLHRDDDAVPPEASRRIGSAHALRAFSKSEVSRICGELGPAVAAFRTRAG
jgi:hypothetical protein